MNTMDATNKVIDTYIADCHTHTVLTAKQEKELVLILNKSKSRIKKSQARDRLINCNRLLVVKLAHRYKKFFNIELMEIINNGNVGLIKAVDLFDMEKFNNRFSTYAYYWIKHHIFNGLYLAAHTVTTPHYIIDQLRHYKEIVQNNKDISQEEIIRIMKIDKHKLRNIKLAQSSIVPLDKASDVEDETSGSLYDVIADDKQIPADEIVANDDKKEFIKKLICQLKPAEKDIIVELFYNYKTLKQVGTKYNLTSECIRQRKNKALNKLKSKLEKQFIFGEM